MAGNFALEIKNLTKIYNKDTPKEVRALNNINLNIEKGKFIALLGPNGAGKSTLINCLSSIVNKTSGDIFISGHNLETDTFLAKKSIGIVPQEINFDPFFNPLQILMIHQGLYGITPNKDFCMNLLDLVGLKGKEKSIIRSLSGGMKRRILIAKSLAHSPDIIILDEPTAGVDVDLRKIIWNRLLELNKKGVTIILTTHYLEEAEFLCDETAIINKGTIIAHDKTSNLIKNIGSKMLIVNVADASLKVPSSISSFFTKEEKNSLYFNYSKDEQNGLIITDLIKHNFNIISVKSVEADLEDVFIKLIDNSNNVPVAHMD